MCKTVSTRFINAEDMDECYGWQIGDVPRHVSRSNRRRPLRQEEESVPQDLEPVTLGVSLREETL